MLRKKHTIVKKSTSLYA